MDEQKEGRSGNGVVQKKGLGLDSLGKIKGKGVRWCKTKKQSRESCQPAVVGVVLEKGP